jgi:chromosomal replication initiation ATPase DnaA
MTYEEQVAHYKAVRSRISAVKLREKPILTPKFISTKNKESILRKAFLTFDVSPEKIKSEDRRDNVVLARGYVMWRFHHDLEMSFSEIGRYFNRRHSTVMRAIRTYEKDLAKKARSSSIQCPNTRNN